MEPINKTLITLIPKTKDPEKMSEIRPISMCNVSYKIIVKAIAKKMKRDLHTVILDNILVGFECIHALSNKRRGKVGHIAIKLDMSKTYDRVEWAFCFMP